MAKKTITVIGADKVAKALAKYPPTTRNNINSAVHKQGFRVEAEVKGSIAGRKAESRSVDTGRFLNSVSTDNSKRFISVISSDVSYAQYLEEGTSRITGRHHFKNSKLRLNKSIERAIVSALKL